MNSLVAYGSDSESDGEQGNDSGQVQTAIQQTKGVMMIEEEEESGKQGQTRLVEPRPPRRQSDLYEDEDGTSERMEERTEDEEEEEEELIGHGENMAKFLMADLQTTGASTPGGAGYTPRANGLEEGEMVEEEQQMQMDDEGEEQQEKVDAEVPPSPPGHCSPTLQRKFEQFFERKNSGWDPNSMIKRRRDFKNPSCYETLVKMFGIDEKGTNFPSQVFDPNAFRPEDFYDALGDHQAAMEAKRKRQQQIGGGIEQQGPNSKRPASLPATKPAESDPKLAASAGRRARFEGK